jgi:phage-related protein
LRSKTESYIQANNIGVPSVSLTVSFAQLEQSEEYKHLKLLERVSLFDVVHVEFPALGVSATAKAVKMVYDVISNRVKSVTLGSVRANIADTVANQQTELEKTKDKPSVSMVQKISSALAKAIMGANGGAVRLIDTNDDGEPDELYIADNADPTQAVKVWRFNYNGWAASKNGYSGPFEFGATLEDGLLANFVTAAQLVAGTIKSQDNGKTFFLDLDNGVLNMSASSLDISGKTVDDIAQEKADNAASYAVNAQTQSDIFNKLTNNGELQGLFMQDGQLYINANYLSTGVISSEDGTIQIDLLNNTLTINTGHGRLVLSGSGLYGYDENNMATLVIKQASQGSATLINALQSSEGLTVASGQSGSTLTLGQPSAKTNIRGSSVTILGKEVEWKDNGDGTFSLAGA